MTKKKLFPKLMVMTTLAISAFVPYIPLTVNAASNVSINSTNFPDANFRQYVKDKFDKDENSKLSTDEIKAVTKINCDDKNISSLTGIYNFTELEELHCDNNPNLTALDLTYANLSKLRTVYCQNCGLKTVAIHPSINNVYLKNNKLTSTSWTGNGANLINLDVSGNQLTSVDVSKSENLINLDVSNNQKLTKLDVSKNTKLKTLKAARTEIGSFNFQNNRDLEEIDISYNYNLDSLLDINFYWEGADKVKVFKVNNCHLGMDDRAFHAGWIPNVENLDVSNNYLTGLVLEDCNNLKTVRMNNNAITYLDLRETPWIRQAVKKNYRVEEEGHYRYSDFSYNLYVDPKVEIITDDTVSEENFPDPNFRDFVSKEYDTEIWESDQGPYEHRDNVIKQAELAAVTKMDLSGKGIKDLKGIELFPNLEQLIVNDNQLTSLNVRRNPNLTMLRVNNNQLESLDVSNNTNLIDFRVSNNQLKSLDVSKNGKLKTLYVSNNQLESLDVSNNTELTILAVDNNQLKDLDVNSNTGLKNLDVSNNQLKKLDVSNNTKLTYLDINNDQLTDLDVSNNTELTYLDVSGNQLKSLDLEKNTKLSELSIYNNQLTNVDVRKVPTLSELAQSVVEHKTDYDEYRIDEKGVLRVDKSVQIITNDANSGDIALDAKNFPDANFLKLLNDVKYDNDKNGKLSKVEFARVKELICNNKNISDLTGIRYFTNLEKLDCSNNQLKALDVSNNIALTDLNVSGNQLERLYVNKHTALTDLNVSGNQLVNLNVSNSKELTNFNASDNQLVSLNVSSNTELKDLNVKGNKLAKLDVRKVPVILELANSAANHEAGYDVYKIDEKGTLTVDTGVQLVTKDELANDLLINATIFPDANFRQYVKDNFDKDGDNKLTEAEVADILEIECKEKNISDLTGIGYFTALTKLDCSDNQLKELDVSKNTALEFIFADKNQLEKLDVSKNTNLEQLFANGNQLEKLDVSKNIDLWQLQISTNNLTELDVSKNTALEWLVVRRNHLTELDVSNNTGLTVLFASSNELNELDVSNNTGLTRLYVDSNHLPSLDVSNNTELEVLSCSGNELKSLDVSKNTKLTALNVNNNQLESLNISKIPTLLDLVKGTPVEHLEEYDQYTKAPDFIVISSLRVDPDVQIITEDITNPEEHVHTYGEPTYTWSDDHKKVTAKRVCVSDASHVETETVDTTSEVTTAPTCEAKGETTYKATFTKEGFAEQTRTVEDIKATGHDWGEWVETTPATETRHVPAITIRYIPRHGKLLSLV